MNAMIWGDFLTIKKTVIQQAILLAFVCLFVSIGTNSLYSIPPIMIMVAAVSQSVTLYALDEQNGWQAFRMALPITRTNVVWGRIALIGILLCAAAAYGILFTCVESLIVPWLAGIVNINPTLSELSFPHLALSAGLGLLYGSVTMAFIFPIASKLGMTRVVTLIPVIGLAVFGVLVMAASSFDPGPVVSFLAEAIEDNPWPITGACVAGSALVFAVSGALSVKLYAKREL